MSRWEVIDVVRTLSTEKVKAGEEGQDSFKFSRGNRLGMKISLAPGISLIH